MDGELQVDTVALRACVRPLLDLGAEVSAGATCVPAPHTVPRWSACDPATDRAGAARSAMLALAASIAATGQAIEATVADYDAADARSAARLRTFR